MVGPRGRSAQRKRRNHTVKQPIIGTALTALLAIAGCGANSDTAVIVKVNQTRITMGELKKQIADLSPDAIQQIAADEKARKDVLNDVIAYELVLQEARRQGLEDMEFTKRQEARRKDMERRLQDEAKNELVTALLKKELADRLSVSVTDAEVKEFYEKNRAKMVTAEGKKVGLQEVAPLIKNRLVSMKQRDVYMEYANKLRDKAKISIKEDALKALAATLSKPAELGSPFTQLPSPKKETGKEKKPGGK